jgi:hypothetical protein
MDNIGIPQEELDKLLNIPYKKETRFIAPVALKNLRFVNRAIKSIKEETKGDLKGLRKDLQKNVNRAFILIVGNLVFSVFERSPLTIPGINKAYNKGGYLRSLFLTKKSVDTVVQALIKHKYIIKKKGNEAAKRANQYQPLKKLETILISLVYQVEEEYKETMNVVIFNNKSESGINNDSQSASGIDTTRRLFSQQELSKDHPDVKALRRINRVLKGCTYPLKSPVYRIFSYGDPMQGGRLYTRLQTLPDRRARIRINTLLNGEPVAEVDLSANHPRMLMALNAHKPLSPTFYEDVAKATKTTRDQVKFFMTRAIGASNRRISLKEGNSKDWSKNKTVMTVNKKHKLEEHLEREYPEIFESLYKGVGIYLQGLEGDILLKTMLKLLDKDIPSLPVHDAVYVQQRSAAKAQKALESSWMEVLHVPFKPVTKIDKT